MNFGITMRSRPLLGRMMATLSAKPTSKKTTERVWERPGTTRYRDPTLRSFNESDRASRAAIRATRGSNSSSAGPSLVARKTVQFSADSSAPFWQTVAATEKLQHGLRADEVHAVLGAPAEAAKLQNTESAKELLHRGTLERILGAATMNNEELIKAEIAIAVQHFQRRGILDTGSPEVQAAIMSVRIRNLERHLIGNRRDTHNRVKLQHLRDARRKMLEYLRRKSLARYQWTVNQLGLPANLVPQLL